MSSRSAWWACTLSGLTILLFAARVVVAVANGGSGGALTAVTVFAGCAAIGAVIWAVLVGRVRSRAATAAQAAPGALILVGDRNLDTSATLNLVFGVRRAPTILAWSFDRDGASLWGAKTAGGPILRLPKERARDVTLASIDTGRRNFPGVAIKVADPDAGIDRLLAFLIRDPKHPTVPENEERVKQELGAIRELWAR